MRAKAKISMRVGLVSVPEVVVYSGIDSGAKISMNQLHAECKHKVQEKLFCPDCAKDILDKENEIVKGYPNGKNEWVVLSKEEIESCKKESNGVMNVFQFVEAGEVPTILYSKPHYFGAGKNSAELYGLVYHGIVENKVMGLGKIVMRQKDHFFCILPYEGILAGFELHFPEEVRSVDEIEKPKANGFDKDTLKMFSQLIGKMTKAFDKSVIRDEYTDALRGIIAAKAAGKVIDISVPKVNGSVHLSLKDMLEQSLAQAA